MPKQLEMIKIDKVKNGYSMDVNICGEKDNYDYDTYIFSTHEEVLEKVKSLLEEYVEKV